MLVSISFVVDQFRNIVIRFRALSPVFVNCNSNLLVTVAEHERATSISSIGIHFRQFHSNLSLRYTVYTGGGALPYWRWRGRAAGQGMIFTVIHIDTGYLNRHNWLLAGYPAYHRVASRASRRFPAHNVYDRPAISTSVTVRAGPQCLWQARDLGTSDGARGTQQMFMNVWWYTTE